MRAQDIKCFLVTIGLLVLLATTTTAQDLTGTWYIQVAASAGGEPPFEALQTFHADGTLTETSSLLATLGEGPAHGVWMPTENGFASTFQLFIFENGEHAGRVQVRSSIQLVGPDSLVADAAVDLILPDGTMIPDIDSTPFAGKRMAVVPVTSTSRQAEVSVPLSFTLHPNYPNPFNPSTIIGFEVYQPSHVHLAIYDILGREVRTLLNRELPVGSYTEEWDGLSNSRDVVASGVYLAQMRAGAFTSTKKMLLVK